MTDVASWVRLQLNGGTLDGKEIVSEEALQPTHTPHIVRGSPGTYDGQTLFYGLGWNVENDHLGYLRWGHSGAFSRGAATNATLLPALGLGVIVLTNGQPIGVPETLVDEIIDQIVTGGRPRTGPGTGRSSAGSSSRTRHSPSCPSRRRRPGRTTPTSGPTRTTSTARSRSSPTATEWPSSRGRTG